MDGKVANVMVGGERLEQVKNFTYLGSTLVEDGKSEKEIRFRIGKATSALAKLDNIWRSKNVEMKNKLQLMIFIVLATLLYACKSWTMSGHDEQRLRASEMKSYRRLLGISWNEKNTNEFVKTKIREICGYELEGAVEMMKKRNFKYFGYRVRGGGTARAVMKGRMEGRRGRGRPQGNWIENLREWSGKRGVGLSRMGMNWGGMMKAVFDWVHARPSRLRSK